MAHEICQAVLVIAGAAFALSPLAAAETAQIPAGTLLAVELIDEVHTGKNKVGDPFRTRLLEAVWAQGRRALPPGLTVRGEILELKRSGRLKGRAEVRLTLRGVQIDASTYTLNSDELFYQGDRHGGKNFGAVLGGALRGLFFGILLGGGDGAAIGAGAGAGAGAISGVINGKEDIIFPQGARLIFELKQALTVPVPKHAPQEPSPSSAVLNSDADKVQSTPAKPAATPPAKKQGKPSS